MTSSSAPKAGPQHSNQPEELIPFIEDLKRQWMATVDALVDPLMIVLPDYRIRKANKALAKLAGMDVRKIIKMKCHEVFAGSPKPCRGCKLQQTVSSLKPSTFDLEGVRPNRFYEVSSQPILTSSGQVDGIVHLYQDRTMAKKMQDKLTQNEKLASIGLLAGGIAHEINNPLGGILIFSQMLLRELDKASPHYEDVVEIEAATKRCKAIVENLLDFARAQPSAQPKLSHAKDSFNLIEAAQTAWRFARVDPKALDVEVLMEWKVEQALMNGNRNKIIQLLLNLMQNAIHAMPGSGMLKLRCFYDAPANSETVVASNGQVLVFEIEDNGVGIPEDILNQIFDPFFTTKDPGEGTGLGLSICYGIVEEHDGSIDVQSDTQSGTLFRLEFPIPEGDSMSLPAKSV